MAAPKGNSYYLLAKETLGRKRIYQTAEEFTEDFLEYVKWCVDNPIISKSATKRQVEEREEVRTFAEPKRRPLSMYGLCSYLGVSRKFFEMSLKNLQQKGHDRTESEDELFTVMTRARSLIENQMFEGACVGDFNANLIIRALGLGDKVDMTSDGEAISSTTPTIINIMRDERCGRKTE